MLPPSPIVFYSKDRLSYPVLRNIWTAFTTQSQRKLSAAQTRQQHPVLTKLKRVKPVNLKKTKRRWQSGLINVTADDHASIQH